MRIGRIGVLVCAGIATAACRPEQVTEPSGVALAQSPKDVATLPVSYSSLATGFTFNPFGVRELTVIELQTGTGKPYGITQNSSGGWSFTGALPNPNGIGFTAVSTGPANNGNLQVVGFTSTGTNYLIYRGASDGAWHWVGALPGTTSPVTMGGRGQVGLSLVDGNTSFFFPGMSAGSGNVQAPWQDENTQWQVPALVGSASTGFATGLDFNIGLPYVIGLDGSGYASAYLEGHSSACSSGTGNCGVWTNEAGYFEPDPPAAPIPFSMVATGRGNGNNMQAVLLGKNDGRLYLSYNTNDNRVWHWYGALPMGAGIQFTQVVADTGNNHSLQVIGLDAASKQPMLVYLDTNGHWHWQGYLPDPNHVQCQSLATGAGNGGNLQVLCLGLDGFPYLIWQSHSDGSWHWYGALPQS